MKAKTFALLAGTVIAGTGIMGMMKPVRKTVRGRNSRKKDLRFDAGYGEIGGVIPTNDVFNWVRVGIGMSGILAATNEKAAAIYNRSLALSYAGMAVLGAIPKTDTLFGVMPIFGGNIFLHAGTAAAELLTEDTLLAKARDFTPLTGKKSNTALSTAVPH